jgi:hypothetical protein
LPAAERPAAAIQGRYRLAQLVEKLTRADISSPGRRH